MQYVNKPIGDNSVRQFVRPLDSLFEDKPRVVYDTAGRLGPPRNYKYLLLERVSRWLPANPSSPERSAQISAAYEPYGAPHSPHGRKIANYRVEERYQFDYDVEQNDCIALIGPRGSGKTTFINHWLSNSSRKWESRAEPKIWFRTDARKVYRVWRTQRKRSVSEVLELYNRVHTLYVLLTYGGIFPSGAWAAIARRGQINKLFAIALIELKENAWYSDILTIENYFLTFIRGKYPGARDELEDISVGVVQHTINDARGDIIEKIDRIYAYVLRTFAAKKIEIMTLLDSVDNISWTQNDTFYIEFCRAIIPFYENVKRRYSGQTRLIISVRPETIDQIELLAHREHGGPGFSRLEGGQASLFCRTYIGVPPSEAVLARKFEAAVSEAFKSVRDEVAAKCDDPLVYRREVLGAVEPLKKSIVAHFESVSAEVKRVYKQSILPEFREGHAADQASRARWERLLQSGDSLYVRLFFDRDMRAMLENLYRTLRVKEYLGEVAGIHGYANAQRLIQYMFLNGNAMMDTDMQTAATGHRKDFSSRGLVFPNLFWFNYREEPHGVSVWMGMCGLRILQTLRYRSNLLMGDLVYLLSVCFGYSRGALIECIEAYVAFGLVEVSARVGGGERRLVLPAVAADPDLSRYSANVQLADKGILYLDYVWCDPAIMYFFALDTPLGVGFVEEDTKYIFVNREFEQMEKPNENFFLSAIPTVATLYRHIKHFDAIERRQLAQRFAGAESDLSPVLNSVALYKQYLELPATWLAEFRALIRSVCETSSAERLGNLRNRVVGVLGFA